MRGSADGLRRDDAALGALGAGEGMAGVLPATLCAQEGWATRHEEAGGLSVRGGALQQTERKVHVHVPLGPTQLAT